MPTLTDFTSLKNIQEILDDRPYLILSPTAEKSLGQWINDQPMEQTDFGIIIGPEGGFRTQNYHCYLAIPTAIQFH